MTIHRVGSSGGGENKKDNDEDDKFKNESGEPIDEQEAEEIAKIIENCGVDERNAYFNMLKAKQERNIETIETTGATSRSGKPAGFRRVG